MRRSDVGLRSERGPILLALMLAMGLVAMDATILATAIPSVVRDLGGFESYPWLFSTYLLAQAVTVPVYSKLADMLGRKPMVLVGIALFLAGSILCGAAWSMGALIAFRVVQGIGAGAIQPIVQTIAGDIYTVEERGRIQGYLGSVWAISAVAGPTLGGFLAQFVDWRWIFFVNVPLCLAAGALIWRNLSERFERREHRIDIAGSALLTVGLTLLLLAVLEGGVSWAWDSPISIALFGAAAVVFIAFALVERRAAEPVLPVRVLTRRIVLTTSLTSAIIGVVIIGLTSFVPTYLQGSIDATPIAAGFALASMTVGWPLASFFSGRIYLRIGFRSTALIGAGVVIAGLAVFSATSSWPDLYRVGAICFVIGAGLGLLNPSTLIAAQSSVPWHERGVVTGNNAFLRTLGSTVGVAVLGSIANSTIAASGGDASSPAAIVAAGGAVLWTVVAVAVLAVATVVCMPHVPIAREEEPGTGPVETAPA